MTSLQKIIESNHPETSDAFSAPWTHTLDRRGEILSHCLFCGALIPPDCIESSVSSVDRRDEIDIVYCPVCDRGVLNRIRHRVIVSELIASIALGCSDVELAGLRERNYLATNKDVVAAPLRISGQFSRQRNPRAAALADDDRDFELGEVFEERPEEKVPAASLASARARAGGEGSDEQMQVLVDVDRKHVGEDQVHSGGSSIVKGPEGDEGTTPGNAGATSDTSVDAMSAAAF